MKTNIVLYSILLASIVLGIVVFYKPDIFFSQETVQPSKTEDIGTTTKNIKVSSNTPIKEVVQTTPSDSSTTSLGQAVEIPTTPLVATSTATDTPSVAFISPTKGSSVKPGETLHIAVSASNCEHVIFSARGDVQTQTCKKGSSTYTFIHTVRSDTTGTYRLGVLAGHEAKDGATSSLVGTEMQLTVSSTGMKITKLSYWTNEGTNATLTAIYFSGATFANPLRIYAIHEDGGEELVSEGVTFDGYDTSVITIEKNTKNVSHYFDVYAKKPEGAITTITAHYKGYTVSIPVTILNA